MSYRTDSIRNIRTIKALRGESLKIDLGKEFQGTLESWMKREPDSLSYRSFEVEDGRYLYLSADKSSDYIINGEIEEPVVGKWYFDVEQDLNDGSDKKTIFRGTIMFYGDITGSQGTEGIPPPIGTISTDTIRLVSAQLESISGSVTLQQEANSEFVTEIKLLKQATGTSKPYIFDAEEGGIPPVGGMTLNSDEFVSSTELKANEIDSEGLDNSYLFDGLLEGNSLVLRGVLSGAAAVFTIDGDVIQSGGVYTIPIDHDNSVGGILQDDEPVSLEGFSTGSTSKLERDITVAGITDNTIGINNGETLEAGSSITDNIERIVRKKIAPTYTAPTVSLSVSPSSYQEIAAVVTYVLTPSFNQNDAGGVLSVDFKRNGVSIHTQANTSPFTDQNRPVSAGSSVYSVEITYDEGLVKDDNLGAPDATGRIEAGTKIGSTSAVGSYRNWFGPFGVTQPAGGDDVRTLGYSYSASFTINTGDSDTVHVIGIPSTKSLTSVIDADALNANITSSYVLSGINTVPDGDGNNVSYKVYTLTLGTPYSANHRHNIIVS